MSIDVIGQFRGQDVLRATIHSKAGAAATILTWGATLADLTVPWRGAMQRVVLGLRSLDDYVKYSPHMGAIAGRFANRIRGGHFDLDGKSYDLPRNFLGKHCLHGGGEGFGKRAWQLDHADDSAIMLSLASSDGDAGFPGNVSVTCEYRLIEPAILSIALTAVSDEPTPINLAPHAYFNLDGEATTDHHTLQVEADFYTPVDADRIPTGEICRVDGTPFDFRIMRGVTMQAPDGAAFAYDINFCLREWRQDALAKAATLRSERNGLVMELWTNQPGLQFYDGHKVDIPVDGIGGRPYSARSALCLEPQRFPNSPNVPHFPSCILRPGEKFRQMTQLHFMVR